MRDGGRRRVTWTAAIATAVALCGPASAAGAGSRVTRFEQRGRQALDGGYERVFGVAHGVVVGRERVRGLPSGGLRYAAQYEVIRPRRGGPAPRPRLLLVEAENRGSPVLLDALTGLEPAATGAPSTARHPAATGTALRRLRLAYARVQWQTGFADGVPATAQGVGEVVVRDVGRALGRRYPRRALGGVSQGAFFVDTFLAEGFNALGGAGRAYQQALTVDGTGNWMAINRLAGAGPQDAYVRPAGRPLPYRRMLHRPRTDPVLVDVANLTDFHRLRAGLTDAGRPPPGVLRYDWPSPHQSFAPAVVFGGLGCNGGVPVPLSPLRYDPYLRALVAGLARGRPPRPRRFALGGRAPSPPAFNGLPGVRVPVPRTDVDGQPVGGVRFPEVDLPLGRLEPVSLSPSVTTSSGAVCGNSGGYAPFPAAAVRARGSQARYVARFDAALRRLVRRRYLRAADRPALLARAAAASRAARG